MRVHAATLVCVLLALSACQKADPGPKAHGAPSEAQPASVTAPASAPEVGGLDLANDLKLSGSGWSLDIGADQLKLERQGKPDLSAKNAGPQMAATAATWTTTASDGSALVVTLTGKPCTDPGGLSQPATATVVIGSETLKGCGNGTPVQVTAASPASTPSGPPVDVE
ncbi:MAG TPA: hypothetical protein VGL66_18895 [Caulobacteraceae bacterium]|jgi:uncharacterized membrane protein